MYKKERRSYDKEFKVMAVKLLQNGKTAVEVGADLGIAYDLVRRWSHPSSLFFQSQSFGCLIN